MINPTEIGGGLGSQIDLVGRFGHMIHVNNDNCMKRCQTHEWKLQKRKIENSPQWYL